MGKQAWAIAGGLIAGSSAAVDSGSIGNHASLFPVSLFADDVRAAIPVQNINACAGHRSK